MSVWDSSLELPRQGLQGQGFARRAMAYLLDTGIYYGVFFATTLFLGILIGFIKTTAFPQYKLVFGGKELPGLLSYGLSFLLIMLYDAVFEWLYGATPAKVLLGMRVVNENGEPCSLPAALIRGVLRLVDSLFFAIPAYAAMSSSTLRQRIGDKAAHTVVVRKDDPRVTRLRPGGNFLLAVLIALLLIVAFALFTFLLTIQVQRIQPSV